MDQFDWIKLIYSLLFPFFFLQLLSFIKSLLSFLSRSTDSSWEMLREHKLPFVIHFIVIWWFHSFVSSAVTVTVTDDQQWRNSLQLIDIQLLVGHESGTWQKIGGKKSFCVFNALGTARVIAAPGAIGSIVTLPTRLTAKRGKKKLIFLFKKKNIVFIDSGHFLDWICSWLTMWDNYTHYLHIFIQLIIQ